MNTFLRSFYTAASALALAALPLAAGVDLVVDAVNFGSDPVVPGDVVAVTVNVTNVGDTAVAPGTTVVVELTSGLAAAGTLRASSSTGVLAGESASVEFSLLISEADANGSYPLSLEVDPDGTIAEDNEGNNVLASATAVQVEAFANLTIDELNIGTASYYPGDTIPVEVSYLNGGERATQGGFTIALTLETPQSGTSTTASVAVGTLAKEGFGSVVINLPFDLDNPNGDYTIRAVIDSTGVIDEAANEGDNEATTGFTVETLPNLRITDLDYETGVWEADDIIRFDLSFHNSPDEDGAGTVRVRRDELYTVRVVLSTDTVFGNEDDFMLYQDTFGGNPVTGGNLLPNDPGEVGYVFPQQIDLSWEQAMPANFYGDFFVLAKIDLFENIEETYEVEPGRNGDNVYYPIETAKISLVPSEDPQATTQRVSVRTDGTEGTAMSEDPALSQDGRYVAFASLAALVEEDEDSFFDIYRRDNVTGEIVLVSASLALAASDGDSQFPAISWDGRYVAFTSESANLVGGDTNGQRDVFVADLATGAITLVSVDATGGAANGASVEPSLSADGTVVVFQSIASDLVAGGTTPGRLHVYARDLVAGTTTLLSAAGAAEGDGDSFEPQISADGAFAVFTTEATNLGGGSTGRQIYRVELATGTALLVSEDGAGAQGNDLSSEPSISADGSTVVYSTLATNIDVPGGWIDRNLAEVIVADIAGAVVTPTRLLTAAGTQFNNPGGESPALTGALSASISADGNRIVIRTQSNNLLLPTQIRSDGDVFNEGLDGPAIGYSDTNTSTPTQIAVSDLYLFDRTSGAYDVSLVSLDRFGYQGTWFSEYTVNGGEPERTIPSVRDGVISPDGRYVAFSSDGRGASGFSHGRTNLLSDDGNEVRDVFLRDLRTTAAAVITNPPTVSITSPVDGAALNRGATTLIEVLAADIAPGYVAEVGLYANGALVATLTDASFYQWTPTTPGLYVLQAIATDDSGYSVASARVNLTVSDIGAPTVTIDGPSGAISSGSSQTIVATATPDATSSSPIVQVEFFVNGTSVGVDAAAPYQAAWTPAGPGDYALLAVATDLAGRAGVSSVSLVTASAPAAPTLVNLTPAAPADLVLGLPTVLSVEASDSDGVASVEFFINGMSIGQATETTTAGTYELAYTPAVQGALNFEAVATDGLGHVSRLIGTYTGTLGAAPVVTLTGPDTTDVAPADGIADGVLRSGETVTLAAIATDPDGTITGVEFTLNGVVLASGSFNAVSGAYEAAYTPNFTGTVTLGVTATDNSGNRASDSLGYSVTTGATPAASLVLPDPTDADFNTVADTPLRLGEAATLSVLATDPDGMIASVRYFVNGDFIGSGSEITSFDAYDLVWTPTLTGVFLLEAVVTDNSGNEVTVSSQFSVVSGLAPVAFIVSPDPTDGDLDSIADSALPLNVPLTWVIDARDSDGAIRSVELFFDGDSLGLALEAGTIGVYEKSFVPNLLGTAEFTARVIDNTGNVTVVSQLYNVVSGSAPVATILSPDPTDADLDLVADGTLAISTETLFAVRASDVDGSIDQVSYYVNGAFVGLGMQRTSFGVYEFDYTPALLGDFDLTVVVTDSTGNETIVGQTYTVTVGAVPTLSIESPIATDANADLIADLPLLINRPITFEVVATDADGGIASVDFEINGRLYRNIGEAAEPGHYRFDYTPSAPGNLVFRATATDTQGNIVTSTLTYLVLSGDLPVVRIVSPPGGGTYLPGTTLPLQASAYDPDGLVEQVAFYLNGILVDLETAPFRTSLSLPSEGTYTLTAIARDNVGNETTSAPVVISVGPLDQETPRAVMTHPLPLGNGDTVNDTSVASESWINVQVIDPDGDDIVAVRFYINGQLIDTVTEGVGDTYATFLDPNAPGSYILFAEAEDAEGNIGQAIPIALAVQELQAPMPTVAVRPILDRSPLREPVQLFAEADGGLVGVDRVDFFANGVLIGSTEEAITSNLTAELYGFTWTPQFTGDFSITARAIQIDPNGQATDNWRISPNAAAITITALPVSTPPSVSLIYPTEGQTFAVGSQVYLQAGATDPDGSIAQVEFFVEDSYLDTPVVRSVDTGAPFTFAWTPQVPGEYRINAVATDDTGDYSRSTTTTVVVGSASGASPQVTMVSPDPIDVDLDGVADTQIRVNTVTTLAVELANAQNPIASVLFYSNGFALGEATKATAPGLYELPWTPDLVGLYDIAAIVRDVSGNETFTSLRYQVVSVAPPTVAMTAPLDGASVTVGNMLILQASASDATGSVSRVEFFQNNQLVGVDTVYPYNTPFVPTSLGTVEFVARATNSSGVTAVSPVVSVSVTGNGPTSIAVANPLDGAGYAVGTQIPLIAEVETTGAGTDLEVSFYVNGEIVGVATEAPFRIFWTPTSPGAYAVSAIVQELSNGAMASAPQVGITVSASTKPVFGSLGPAVGAPTAGSDVQVIAEVSDADGFVSSVRFSVNGQALGTDTSAPFSVFWNPQSAGTYTLEAEAVDNAGNITLFSNQIVVGQPVGQVPSLSLGITANGNVTPGSRVVVTANVYDDDPENVTVTFFLNGSQIGEPDAVAPYSTLIEPKVGFPPNVYSLTALAIDSDGNSRAVSLAPLYISDVSVDQPSVEIVTPSAGDTLTEGSRASLRARVVGGAVDNIAEVVFYANGVRIDSDRSAPYSIDWLPDQVGSVSITAAVLQNTEDYDHDNDNFTPLIEVTPVTIANPVEVTVNPPVGVLPSVSFQVLPQTTDIAQGSQIMLFADAQDLDGTVASVEFFLDGVSLGAADTSRPFSQVWTARSEGEFYINAVATDDQGNVVNSNFVPVQVAATVVSKTPAIDLTVPTSAQAGDFITLRSSVRDFVNGPEGVVFYVDGQPVGSASVKPFNYIWEANLEGDVSVFATARQTLASGAVVTATSPVRVIALEADEDPVITNFAVSYPGAGAAKPDPLVNEPLTFTVEATDNGRIELLELIRNGETVRSVEVNTSVTILTETPPGLGLYSYSVVVTDNAGRQVQSSAIEVDVVVGAIPTVEISSPDSGDTYLPGESITVRANALDTDGTIVGVQFYVNGVPQGGPIGAVPYAVTINPGTDGTYVFTARAEDNSGNISALSAPVTITVLVDEAPEFTNFSVNLADGAGTQLNPYIVRLGTPFTIDTEALDDQGLSSVILLRNSSQVAAPAGAEVPVQFSDVLTTPGIYGYRAEATDTGNNVTTSSRLFVRSVQGSKPDVAITSPFDGAQVQTGVSVAVRVEATPADEPVGPNGSITQVEFRANGTPFAVRSSAPYTAGFTPTSEGQWEISVVATSDTGINSEEAIITLNAIDEDLPEILSFTNDTSGNRSLFGIPITFAVTAQDTTGIRAVEFYRVGRTEPLGTSLSEPHVYAYTPYALDGGTAEDDRIAAGTHLFFAKVISASGAAVDSEPVEINIRYPDPLNEIEDFVFQSYLDLYLRIPTEAERNAAVSNFDSGQLPTGQDAADALVLNVLQSGEYALVRSALLAHYLLVGEWPDRHTLESGARLVAGAAGASFAVLSNNDRAVALTQYVQLLMPVFEADFPGGAVPSAASPSPAIDAFVSYLWELKYGQILSDPSRARTLFRAYGRDAFVARFVLDVGNIVLPSGAVKTPVLGFDNVPNDRFLQYGDAASLYLNLLRIAPDQAAVEELAQRLPAARVQTLLEDPRYAARFTVADVALIHLEDGWKQSSWLGDYHAEPDGWNYHTELGWVWFEMQGQSAESFWYWDRGTGWSWTREGLNPFVYSSKEQAWLYRYEMNYEAMGQTRWFYNFAEQGWRNY